MKIEFYVNPHQASMNVKVSYCKEEINQKHFYLNRDFVVNQCIVDGVEYDIYNYSQLTSLAYLNGYTVNKYLLPQYFSEIVIDYTGYLSGKTGCCPYVREKLSPEFSLIRWETFCYPIFFQDDAKTLMEFLRFNTEVEIVVTVKNEFLVVSDGDFIENSHENDIDKYVFKSNSLNISIAIAKYIIKELTMGKFYLLGDIDTNQLENTLVTAHDFMNIHFGVRNISSNVIYVAIPQGFGSFALPKIVFIEESTFKSAKSMNEIIHEFIHLGWNAKSDITDVPTRRMRFFDEAFTSYFEIRVMEHLLKDNSRLNQAIEVYKYQLDRLDSNIPIIEFGEHEYGDLSYTIGAICLCEMSKLIGIQVFDHATQVFLEKYRFTPVNMELFCNEYIDLCKNPELNKFFKDWIYSTNGPKSFISQNTE